jgi:hypothetical protein
MNSSPDSAVSPLHFVSSNGRQALHRLTALLPACAVPFFATTICTSGAVLWLVMIAQLFRNCSNIYHQRAIGRCPAGKPLAYTIAPGGLIDSYDAILVGSGILLRHERGSWKKPER